MIHIVIKADKKGMSRRDNIGNNNFTYKNKRS